MQRCTRIALLYLCMCGGLYSQQKAKYNLDFSDLSVDGFAWNQLNPSACKLDSTEKYNGKYPICIENEDFFSVRMGNYGSLSQLFVIPNTCKSSDSVKISITNKCMNIGEIQMKIFCYGYEDQLLYIDSVDINNDSIWSDYKSSFQLNNTAKMVVGVYFIGLHLANEIQNFWIDRISIQINNQDIENYAFNENPCIVPFNESEIMPLDIKDEKSFSKIPIPANKKVIAIGESINKSKQLPF